MDWKPLFCQGQHCYFEGGYHPTFNRNKQYQFRRNGGEPFLMRLSEQADWFNVAGLEFRSIESVFASSKLPEDVKP